MARRTDTGRPIRMADANVARAVTGSTAIRCETRDTGRPACATTSRNRFVTPSARIIEAAKSALTLPRFPSARYHVRDPELLRDLDRDGLLSFEAQAVDGIREVDAFVNRQALDHCHAAVEVGVDREHGRAARERLHELRRRDLAARQHDDRRDAGCRRVSGERGRRIARGRAAHRAHAAAAIICSPPTRAPSCRGL
jgi:hypothetical protein